MFTEIYQSREYLEYWGQLNDIRIFQKEKNQFP